MSLSSSLPAPAISAGAKQLRERSLRLWGAAAIWLAILTFLLGAAWDIQWHPAVGRDRALTPPHIFFLGGMALAGLLSAGLVLLETWRARRGLGVDATNSTPLFVLFRAPIGLAVTGFGALLGTLGFPLDDYWHRLYGIDVTLWAPFHVMIIGGMLLASLGLCYLVASELNRGGAAQASRWLQAGFASSIALFMATLLLLLPQAQTNEGLAHIAGYDLALHPLLSTAMVSLGLVTAALVLPRPGTPLLAALTLLAIKQLMYWIIPTAMDHAVASEGLMYRPGYIDLTYTPFAYPSAALFAALPIEAALWLRRAGPAQQRWILLSGWLGALLVPLWDRPWAYTWPRWYFPGIDTQAVLLRSLPLAPLGALIGVGLAALVARGLARVTR